jgi:hypothetical protein
MSEGQNFEEQFERLLWELHQVPEISKPPLGKNPFAKQPSGVEIPVTAAKDSAITDLSKLNNDVVSIQYRA